MCIRDRFCILRLPPDINDDAEIDPSDVGHAFENEKFPGAKNKVELSNMYHIGSPITGLCLSQGDFENTSIVYGTVDGEIGLFIPLKTDTDARLFRLLEDEMKKLIKSPVGRFIEQFRSYYTPLKCVNDSNLLLSYIDLPTNLQKEIAEKLKVKPFDLSRLLAKVDSSI